MDQRAKAKEVGLLNKITLEMATLEGINKKEDNGMSQMTLPSNDGGSKNIKPPSKD